MQRGGRPVGQHRHAAPADPLRLPDLYRDAGQDLLAPGTATAQARLLAADVGLVDFHRPGQPDPARPYQHRPQPVQHRPRRLVRADLQRALHAQRGDAVLAASEHPADGKPDSQRRARPVEDRPGRHRGTSVAAGAPEPAITHPPAAGMAAALADEPARPAQPLQVVQAVRIGTEPRLELARRPRVMHAPTRTIHTVSLRRLNGDPQGRLCGVRGYADTALDALARGRGRPGEASINTAAAVRKL